MTRPDRFPLFEYEGVCVLVTGGTSGIGAATAAAYRDAGADVTVTGTRPKLSDYGGDLYGFNYEQLDLEDSAAIDAVALSHPRLDILINNGGIAFPSIGLDEYEPEIFARAVNLHLIASYRLAHRCFPALSRSKLTGGGSIVSVASMASFFGVGIVPGYGAAKTGLLGLTRALAVEWGPRNVRINAVAVGLTHSRMTAGTIAKPEWSDHTLARTPLGRHGQPEDVAGPILFLTSPAASWITGQTLAVDGGFTIAG